MGTVEIGAVNNEALLLVLKRMEHAHSSLNAFSDLIVKTWFVCYAVALRGTRTLVFNIGSSESCHILLPVRTCDGVL